MSLLSGLDSHDRNPRNKWGLYSQYNKPADYCNKSDANSDDGSDEEVYLVTLPSQATTRKSTLRNAKLEKPQTVEIKDDNTSFRSNTDKNPKDFHARTSTFTIPKTKKQTGKEKSVKKSPQGNWLRTGLSNGQRLMTARLQLVPDAQGRTIKRTSDNSNDKPDKPMKLSRPWNHAENPLSRNLGRKSLETACRNGEEIRCALCNDIISTKDGCLTCPKRSDNDTAKVTALNSDELSEDGFLVPVKRSPPGAGCGGKRSPPGSGFTITSDRYSKSEEAGSITSDVHKTKTPGPITIDSSQESQDFIETAAMLAKNDITQDDMFCQVCGKARSAKGCGCKQSAENFYGKKSSGKTLHLGYCGKTYADGGIFSSNLTPKRERCEANAQKKKAKLKEENCGVKQTTVATAATVSQARRGRKKNETKKPKEPVCVHISSDEDEIPLETTCTIEISAMKDFHSSGLNVLDEMFDTSQEASTSKEIDIMAKNLSPLSTIDVATREETSLSDVTSNIPKKSNSKKRKKSGCKVATNTEDKELFLITKYLAVGNLFGYPMGPVEITKEMISFKMKKDEQEYSFRLEKNNLVSFKLHSEEPVLAFLTPTSGWARKFVEKYWHLGHSHFICPTGKVYNDKHIILFIREKITSEMFEELTELVDNHLSDDPILERLSLDEAKSEANRITESVREQEQAKRSGKEEKANKKTPVVISPSIAEAPPVVKSSVTKSPVVKSYSTRSKSVVVPAPKRIVKNILVYQPSQVKLNGVTITEGDMLCLEPHVYLNDVIIDFFFEYLIEEKLEPSDRERIHLFNTFFYERLTNKITYESSGPNFSHRMGKWTKNVDIFSKDFLIIPINEYAHWFLVIICFPSMAVELATGDEKEISSDEATTCLDSTQEEGKQDKESEQASDDDDFDRSLINTTRETKKKSTKKKSEPMKARPCILIFDSLGTRRRPSVSHHLRNYLNCEWKERKDNSSGNLFDKDTLKVSSPKVPFQENYSDCGLYVLKFFESFFTKPIQDYRFPIDLRSWFSAEEVSGNRQYITNVIYELASKKNR